MRKTPAQPMSAVRMPIEAAVVETKGKGGEGRIPDVEPGGQQAIRAPVS